VQTAIFMGGGLFRRPLSALLGAVLDEGGTHRLCSVRIYIDSSPLRPVRQSPLHVIFEMAHRNQNNSVEPPRIAQFLPLDTPAPSQPLPSKPKRPVHANDLQQGGKSRPSLLGRRKLQKVPTLRSPKFPRNKFAKGSSALLGPNAGEKAKPPDDIIQEVETARHGNAEALYQSDISPPIRDHRPPPPRIQISEEDLIDVDSYMLPQESKASINTSTWAGLDTSTARLIPPVPQDPMKSPGSATPSANRAYDTQRPTCSLNVVCYRAGAEGCVLGQINTALMSRVKDEKALSRIRANNPDLVWTDKEFFAEVKRIYEKEMCGFWRKRLSMKTLSGLRVLSASDLHKYPAE
jgi:hypothetical protein